LRSVLRSAQNVFSALCGQNVELFCVQQAAAVAGV